MSFPKCGEYVGNEKTQSTDKQLIGFILSDLVRTITLLIKKTEENAIFRLLTTINLL